MSSDEDADSGLEDDCEPDRTQIISDVLSKGLSVKVNGIPWQRVLIKIDEETDEAVIILFGLMPGRQYDVELGIVPGERTLRGQFTTGESGLSWFHRSRWCGLHGRCSSQRTVQTAKGALYMSYGQGIVYTRSGQFSSLVPHWTWLWRFLRDLPITPDDCACRACRRSSGFLSFVSISAPFRRADSGSYRSKPGWIESR